MAVKVSRTQVLAYRTAAHGLDRAEADPSRLDVLDLGIQHGTQAATVRVALTARLPHPPMGADDPMVDDAGFALLWSFRGAPHLHRRADLPGLVAALWPLSDADAMSRLPSERAAMKAAGISGLEAFTAVAKALRAVVTKPMEKGAVSAGVTSRLPAAYSYACRSCAATHISGGIFQLAGLPAGIRHVPDRSPLTLRPLEGRPVVPTRSAGTADVMLAYLRLHGPATMSEVASYLGTTQAHVRPIWPEGLAEVTVDGRRCFVPEDRLADLRNAARPQLVRLLPPLDPYIQARDRDLLVPDPAHQKDVWKILGNPGALLVDGEIVGTWRSRTVKKSLTITVQPWGQLPKKARTAVEEEAGRIAAVRGARGAEVVYGT